MVDVRKTSKTDTSVNSKAIYPENGNDKNISKNRPKKYLSKEVFETLPERVKNDLDQVEKCMAYGYPTIATFYLFRGTESILKDFYCSIVDVKLRIL